MPELIVAKPSVETNDLESENEEPDERARSKVIRVVGGEGPLRGKPHDDRKEDESDVQQGPPPFVHARAEFDVLYRSLSGGLSEELVPRKARWWREEIRQFVKWKRENSRVSERWLRTIRQLGVPVSDHDLRRSFGRITYRNGYPLVIPRNLLGQETLEITIHHVGVDSDDMAEGLDRFEQAMRESLTVPRQ